VSDLDEAGGEAVLTSAEPIGFDLPADWPPPPRVMPIGSGQAGLEVCADSFAEFLYRFWIEDEIYFRQGRALSPAAAHYAAGLLHAGGARSARWRETPWTAGAQALADLGLHHAADALDRAGPPLSTLAADHRPDRVVIYIEVGISAVAVTA
jgi:hypothetical protein